jgi:hypothetical protein
MGQKSDCFCAHADRAQTRLAAAPLELYLFYGNEVSDRKLLQVSAGMTNTEHGCLSNDQFNDHRAKPSSDHFGRGGKSSLVYSFK